MAIKQLFISSVTIQPYRCVMTGDLRTVSQWLRGCRSANPYICSKCQLASSPYVLYTSSPCNQTQHCLICHSTNTQVSTQVTTKQVSQTTKHNTASYVTAQTHKCQLKLQQNKTGMAFGLCIFSNINFICFAFGKSFLTSYYFNDLMWI